MCGILSRAMLMSSIANTGFQVLVLGLGIVFSILALLILFISLLERISVKKSLTTDDTNIEDEIVSVNEDGETVAAITAAIYAVLSAESDKRSNIGFRVRSIRRI